MKEKRLIANRVQTPDGTILWSRHVHDCVFYEDSKTGERYMLDGGTDYIRASVNKIPAKNVSVYDNARWKTLRQYVIRNTVLLDSNMRPTGNTGFVRICDMSDQHLVALKEYVQEHAGNTRMVEYILKEQMYRKRNNITIPEHDYTSQLVQAVSRQ